MFLKFRIISVTLLMACVLFQACASLGEVINIREVFKGNTQRDPQNYTLEDKSEYRKHNYLLRVKQKEDDKEVLERMKQDEKKKSQRKNQFFSR